MDAHPHAMNDQRCTCATDGNARRCPHHTQEDFDAADRAIGRLSDDYADLARLAEAATPGPWQAGTTGRAGGDHWYVCHAGEAIASISAQDGINEGQRQSDAEFIAAANPATILRLIAENRRLAALVDAGLGKSAEAAALAAERDVLAARMPCDGGCNYGDGPMEDCSRHGRPPAEVWQIVTEVQAQRDALAARLAAVEALVSEWERVQEQNRTALGELARGATHLLLDTPGPADFRAVLSAAPTDTTKEN